MADVNKERGESLIELGGKEFVLKPNWKVYAMLEASTNLSSAQIHISCCAGNFSMFHTVDLIYFALSQSEEKPPTKDEVGKMVLDGGLLAYGGPCIRYMSAALHPPKGTEPKKAQEAGETNLGESPASSD